MVRECGRDVTCPDAKEVLYTLKERAYVEQIEKAYNYASKVLLDFLMEEKELVSRLRYLNSLWQERSMRFCINCFYVIIKKLTRALK